MTVAQLCRSDNALIIFVWKFRINRKKDFAVHITPGQPDCVNAHTVAFISRAPTQFKQRVLYATIVEDALAELFSLWSEIRCRNRSGKFFLDSTN